MKAIKFALTVILISMFLIAANWLLAPALDVHVEASTTTEILDEIESELTHLSTNQGDQTDLITFFEKLLKIMRLLDLLDA